VLNPDCQGAQKSKNKNWSIPLVTVPILELIPDIAYFVLKGDLNLPTNQPTGLLEL